MEKLKGFNARQSEAILSPINEDVVISAGAGSGKTKTLSSKVKRMIEKKELDPSRLLVLTFTNNAAYEMKQRIVAQFKDDPLLADKMLSCHIQTFDSFNQYLVGQYAERLGISPKLKIIDENLLKAKSKSLLEQMLRAEYEDEQRRNIALSSIKVVDTTGDESSKKLISDLADKLSKIPPENRVAEVNRMLSSYDDEETYRGYMDEYVDSIKEKIRNSLLEAEFAQSHQSAIQSGDPALLKALFSGKGPFLSDPYKLSFSHDDPEEKGDRLYQAILDLLSKDGEEFLIALQGFKKNQKDNFPARLKKGEKDDPNLIGYIRLKSDFLSSDSLGDKYGWWDINPHFKENLDLRRKMKPVAQFFLTMAMRLLNALDEYKRRNNAYGFDDIAHYALHLLKDDEEASLEIRSRFDFIMVDEYQDTNPNQEAFLDALLSPRPDGSRAHLFAVGDAKQAIYGFRGSDVSLFRKRQLSYADGKEGHRMIPMNQNYRSGKKILEQINFLFSYYMRPEHGGIDYNDPNERLSYDDEVNLYGESFQNFGILRLVSPERQLDGMSLSTYSREKAALWEAKAIIHSIRKKVDEGYLVYDRSPKPGESHIRRCRYGDFCILMRKKSYFPLFKKEFELADIPLNLQGEDNLGEDDPFILIQSLCGLWLYVKGERQGKQLKHLLASILRSYAYRYDDQAIHEMLRMDEGALFGLPIYLQMEEFDRENGDRPFSSVFLELLNEFGVISALSGLGDVAKNMAKIDSVYSLIKQKEALGEGLSGFYSYLGELNKYRIENNAETITSNEDAVELMSIHASKGLERKYVFLPCCGNYYSKGGGLDKPRYEYSSRFGPIFDLGEGFNEFSARLDKLEKDNRDADIDELVRLYYVAFTRAENSICIVGDDNGSPESLYSILESAPHSDGVNPELLDKLVEKGVLTKDEVDGYLASLKASPRFELPLSQNELGDRFPFYLARVREYLIDGEKDRLGKRGEQILQKARDDFFLPDLANKAKAQDLDFLARLYALSMLGLEVLGVDDLLKAWGEPSIESQDPDSPLSQRKGKSSRFFLNPGHFIDKDGKVDKDHFLNYLSSLAKELSSIDEAKLYFGSRKAKGGSNDNPEAISYWVGIFSKLYFGFASSTSQSYGPSEEPFPEESFDIHSQAVEVKTPQVGFPEAEVDDSEIPFPAKKGGRASKQLSSDPEESALLRERLSYGERLHAYMELIDFHNPDLSFIADPREREKIEKALELEAFKVGPHASYRHEFGYYDEEFGTTGFIDLLIIDGDEYRIVDYKASDIDDPAYVEQLHAYKRNIVSLFNAKPEKVSLYLVSLLGGRERRVE